MFKIPVPSMRTLLIACAALALVALLAVKGCSNSRETAEQARQDARSAGALADTAEVAVEAVIARTDEEATVDDIVSAAIEEIDNAPTDQAAGAAARAAICRLPDYRADPACQLRPVHP